MRLHLYLDRSSLEVFVDDGATVGSLLVFTAPSCQEIVLGAKGTATITSGSLTPPGRSPVGAPQDVSTTRRRGRRNFCSDGPAIVSGHCRAPWCPVLGPVGTYFSRCGRVSPPLVRAWSAGMSAKPPKPLVP